MGGVASDAPNPAENLIAGELPIRAQNQGDDAITSIVPPAIKPPENRQQKALPLPVLKGKAGRVHSDEELDDILRTMLRDGKAPYGKTRQQFNYRSHVRLSDLFEELVQEGMTIHATFRSKAFWREWAAKTGKPLHASFYRKLA